jgi:hypothetical protein
VNVQVVPGAVMDKMQKQCRFCRRLLQFSKNGWKEWKGYEVDYLQLGIGLQHLRRAEQPGHLQESFGSRFF